MYQYVAGEIAKPSIKYFPKAAVILPCKGIDPGFRENLKKLLTQDYGQKLNGNQTANFEIIFTVADNKDPAYSILQKAIEENPHVQAKLVIAGIDNKRAQKITNQLTAIKHISADTEVLIFVDSDVVAKEDFLSNLVAPLQDSLVGISTGYRFYLPSQFNLPGLIRSLWNRMTVWELSNKRFAFAWGGAMAIRRQTFEQANITKVWDRAADDDLSMTTAVKKLGLRVHFAPRCLVISHGEASWSEMIEWTNRQLILTKVYYPRLWLLGIIRAGIMMGWLVLVLSLAIQIIGWQTKSLLPVLLAALSLLIVEIFFLWQGNRLWQQLLHRDTDKDLIAQAKFKKAYQNLLWQSAIVLPIAHIFLPVITLYSLLTNRIRWRGIYYELRSPEETVVI
jgi:cellulose synthase/poly-beta-1,6-N-acetylglucosamine synthase-like glycosyltransferase